MLTPGGIYGVQENIGVPRPVGVYRLSLIFHSPNAKGLDHFITGAHQTPEIAIATEGPGAKWRVSTVWLPIGYEASRTHPNSSPSLAA